MSEDRIERIYEREMDILDEELMRGYMTQIEYDREVKLLNEEINAMYHELRHPNCRY